MRKRMLLTKASMWLMKGWNSIDLASQLLLMVVILMRLTGQHITEVKFYVSSAACCAVLLWSKMLFFMMPFATTGALLLITVPSSHRVYAVLLLSVVLKLQACGSLMLWSCIAAHVYNSAAASCARKQMV